MLIFDSSVCCIGYDKPCLLPESKCAVISEISNASKMERNGAVKMENTDALF
jgi:hypothetical protein